jgi:hypothetical protein
MSWILGSIGAFTEAERARISSIHDRPLTVIQTRNLYLAAGGISATCLHGRFTSTQNTPWDGWMIVGLGIRWERGSCSFYSTNEWSKVLAAAHPDFSHLDGHFVALRYNDREIQIFTDPLGLRGAYASKIAGGFVFSTRLDWTARISHNSEIDFEAFGPQWLAFNQISYSSPVRNVIRLGQGSRARCTAASFESRDTLWSPRSESNNEMEFENVLKPFLAPTNVPQEAISFGLSGGLDSRVMLALYISMGIHSIKLHVFGDPQNPDVVLSSAIGERLKFEHVHEEYIPRSSEELLAKMKEYLAQIYVTNPASGVIDAGAFYEVAKRSSLILDASWAEIARRQCFNRLLIAGSKALKRRNAKRISSYLTIERADIFSRDALETMKKGLVQQVQWYLDVTFDNTSIANEDFADLLAVRTRMPNYSGFEQARIDSFVMAYMPFLQPSILRSVFRIPLHDKRKGRLFRRMILHYCPELASFPLAKGGTTYPFWLAPLPAHAWTLVKKKLSKPFVDRRTRSMLEVLKEYALDLVHSQELQTCQAYDVKKVQSMVERYYSGEFHLEHHVDWWLSFEFWRQAMK